MPRHARRRSVRRRPAAVEIRLETLEDRCLLSFNPLATLSVGMNAQTEATADFNDDGRLDLAKVNAGDNANWWTDANPAAGSAPLGAANRFEAGGLQVDSGSWDPYSILVRFRPDSGPAAAVEGTRLGRELSLVPGLSSIRLDPGTDVARALDAYRADPDVLYASPNYIVRALDVPNDPQYGNLWGLNNMGQTGGTPDADIDHAELAFQGNGSTVVAVIDTGIDYTHPDLADNIWTNTAEAGGAAGVDDDLNGYVDDIHGYDFVNDDGDPMDDHYHGTHVAGTIGAVANNSIGVAGVSWNVQLMAVKFLDSGGGGTLEGAVLAIEYVIANQVPISNNSWGGGGFFQPLYDAIAAAGAQGHLFVAAAGNSGVNADFSPMYPAAYDLENIVSVAATDHTDALAYFSNYGASSVDLGAPGVSIYSTMPRNSYGYLDGTSMASPHVAGVAALVRDLHPTWGYQEIKDVLLSSVDPIGALAGKSVSGGRLNAVAAAIGTPPPDTTGPRVNSSTPSGVVVTPVSSVRLSFNEPVVNFDLADIGSFTGPGGAITPLTVAEVVGSSGRQYDVTFASQSAEGTYTMLVGPGDVLDASGNSMDQDRDGIQGEAEEDVYTASFTIRVPVFLAPVSYGVGSYPYAITAADFNGDAVIDLAVANYSDSTVSVLLGDGFGGFGTARSFGTGTNPHEIAVGDFDGDGDMDLVTANYYDLSVLLNNGDGTFAEPQNLYLGSNPLSVAVGDFNADGKIDLGVGSTVYYYGSYYWYGYYGYQGSVNVLIGNGDGSFSDTGSNYLNTPYPESVAVGDVNNDDKLDLITGDGYYGGISVLLGNGDGTIQFPTDHYTGDLHFSMEADDLNADGDLDLVAPGYYGGAANVLLGDGRGGFTNQPYAAGTYPGSAAVGDFDQDGLLDIITANTGSNDVTMLRGNGNGTFQPPVPSAAGSGPWQMAVDDFNGDHALDVAVTNSSTNTISVLLNKNGVPPAPPPPSLTISNAAATEGHTGTVEAAFVVSLSHQPTEPVTVHYATADGTATTADGDYEFISGMLTFDVDGPLTQTIPVLVNGDRRGELNESFVVNLTSGDAPVIDGQGTGTIVDDEPTLSIADASPVTEGHSGLTAMSFTVTLSAAYDVDVTVDFATQDGSATTADNDYQIASGIASIAAGTTTTTVVVNVNGDEQVEADESLSVLLSSPTNARIVDDQATGTIRNDDDATKFYVVDASADRTYEYDPTGAAVENYGLQSGNNDPRGAASDASGQRVWVIDDDDYVYVYDAAGNPLGSWKANGLKTPEGIASDGVDLWIVDRNRDRVYRFAGAASRASGSASPTSSFALNSGNREARGIETDGTYLWVVNNASTDKVFKYTLAGQLRGSWTLTGGVTNPTGITLDPSSPSDVWIVDASADKVFQYAAAASRTSGSQSASAVFNLASGNTNPQGITDPPPAGAAAVPSGEGDAAGFDRLTSSIAATAGSRAAAPAAFGAANPQPLTRGMTTARRTDETPLILHGSPMISAVSGPQRFASGESLGTVSVEIERDEWEDDDRISLSLFETGDAVFGNAEGLGQILDDRR